MSAPEFLVLSRVAAIAYEPTAPTEVCISITDPGGIEVDVPLSPRFADVLRLAFSDICGPSSLPFDVLFATDHARAIIDFVRRWQTADRIVIHCVGGRSRSAGVALGLCDRLGVRPDDLEQRHPLWNTWVRSAISRCESGDGSMDASRRRSRRSKSQ